MQFSSLFITFIVLGAATPAVMGESPSVTFTNNCGSGTPQLVQGGTVLSSGGTFTIGGPLISAIAYLQRGNCGLNGELYDRRGPFYLNKMYGSQLRSQPFLPQMTLKNPDPNQPGSGSSVDLSFIPPHGFDVRINFHYTGGCSDGATCSSADCPSTEAFHDSDDFEAQRACQANDAGLQITFCP
ncbi:hypothetical protein PM082_024800 [Marasmius tenuissimus]|nr:hypothetical protein PM082_024800 [Marasmius tenuissimus]